MPLRRSERTFPAAVVKGVGDDDAKTEAAMAAALQEVLETFAASAMSKTAIDALGKGNANAFMSAFDWDTFSRGWADATLDPLAGVHLAKGMDAMLDLAPVSAMLDFDLLEPRAIQWATQHAGSLVTNVSSDIRTMVNGYVTAALKDKVDVRTTAKLISERIPLTPRYAAAVDSTYDRTLTAAIKAGKTADQARAAAEKASQRQAARLTKARATNIARTEVMAASNQGRYDGWSAQIGKGAASIESRKEWTTGADPCPHICDPLTGEVVMWDKPFSNGMMMPPGHNGCRCTAVLLPPDVPLRAGDASRKPATVSVGGHAPTSNPDAIKPGTKLNAGHLTNEQGSLIASSAMRQARGDITAAQHKAYVREVTHTDSAGKRLPGTPPDPKKVAAPGVKLVPEEKFVNQLVGDLESGKRTVPGLRSAAEGASPLGRLNAETAITRYESKVGAPKVITPTAPVRTNRALPETPKSLVEAMKPGKSGYINAQRKGMIDAIKETPAGRLLHKTLKPFQSGGSTAIPRLRTDIEKYLAGGALDKGRADAIENLLSAANSIPVPDGKVLYRGMQIPGSVDDVLAKYAAGGNVDISLASFTSDRKTGIEFTTTGAGQRIATKKNTPVLVEWDEPNRTGIPLENIAPSPVFWSEREWVTSGRYTVTESVVKKIGGRETVVVKIRREAKW